MSFSPSRFQHCAGITRPARVEHQGYPCGCSLFPPREAFATPSFSCRFIYFNIFASARTLISLMRAVVNGTKLRRYFGRQRTSRKGAKPQRKREAHRQTASKQLHGDWESPSRREESNLLHLCGFAPLREEFSSQNHLNLAPFRAVVVLNCLLTSSKVLE